MFLRYEQHLRFPACGRALGLLGLIDLLRPPVLQPLFEAECLGLPSLRGPFKNLSDDVLNLA